MRILFLGVDSYEHILPGLVRLGHDVVHVDPSRALPNWPGDLARRWAWRSGGWGFEPRVERYVLDAVAGRRFDVALVLRGDLVSRRLVERLPAQRIVNFNNDHPFGARDGGRWRLFKAALPAYDLFVTPRQVTAEAATALGARRALQVRLWADEVAHRPLDRDQVAPELRSHVCFAGTWMPERGPFMARLLDRGVPLTIFGARWHRAPEYDRLKRALRPGWLGGDAYRQAIAGSHIAVALLSERNEDLHTRRSVEIPALGRVLCAPRTRDHLAMYDDGVEALFFDDADACADQCLALLADPQRLATIAERGRARCLRNGDFTEPTLTRILEAAIRG
jgi:spore maturation protein CgeB